MSPEPDGYSELQPLLERTQGFPVVDVGGVEYQLTMPRTIPTWEQFKSGFIALWVIADTWSLAITHWLSWGEVRSEGASWVTAKGLVHA